MTSPEGVTNGLVSDFGDGSYLATFGIVAAGPYSLSAFLGIEAIVQSAPVTLIPSNPSTSQIVLSTPIPVRKSAAVDVVISFQMRDQYSNVISDCTDISTAIFIYNSVMSIVNQTKLECYSGSFNSTIVIRRSGSYFLGLNWTKFNLLGNVLGSPFPCNVVSANADPTQCIAESRFLSIGGRSAGDASTVGIKRSLKIFARDSWGNSVQNDPYSVVESFKVFFAAVGKRCSPACPSTCNALTGLPEAEQDVCVSANVINNYDSTFSAEWTATVADSYSVVVTLRSVPIRSSPFSFTAGAGTLSLKTSELFNIPTQSIAGKSVTFFAKTLDEWGNELAIGDKVNFSLFFYSALEGI
jgi:hypothetical protein